MGIEGRDFRNSSTIPSKHQRTIYKTCVKIDIGFLKVCDETFFKTVFKKPPRNNSKIIKQLHLIFVDFSSILSSNRAPKSLRKPFRKRYHSSACTWAAFSELWDLLVSIFLVLVVSMAAFWTP